MLYRRVRLSGRLEADFEWDANMPVEFVRVNGRKVASAHAFLRSAPRYDFHLSGASHVYSIVVEVKVAWIYFVRGFRIVVDGETAYAEGVFA